MSETKNPKNSDSLKKKFKKIPFLSVTFWAISIASIAAVILLAFAFLQGAFSSKKERQEFRNFNEAKSAFESRTGVDKEWFQEGVKLPEFLLFINTNKDSNGNKKFIWTAQGSRNEIAFTDIRSTANAGKKVIDSDTTKFNSFIAEYLSIETGDNVNTIAEKIGAKTDYISDISNVKNHRDIVFSLIYNTIVGDPQGLIAVTIENKKLKIITVKNFLWDRIDVDLFVKSMNWVANTDTLSNKDKFIWASYKQLSNTQQRDVSNTPKNKFKEYFNNDNIVQINCKLPVNFLYYDFRKNVLHIGVNEVAKNKAEPKQQQYISKLLSSPEKVFYLVENDTTLYDFSNFHSTENILWGKIDTAKLANGKFKTDDFVSDYGIIKTWNNAFMLYIAIIILFVYVVLLVVYWICKRKKQVSLIPTEELKTQKKSELPTIDETSLKEEEKGKFEQIKQQYEKAKAELEKQYTDLLEQKQQEANEYKRQRDEKNTENEKLNTEIITLKSENTNLKTKIGNALEDFRKLSDKKGKDLIENILKTYDTLLKGRSQSEYNNILKTEKEEFLTEFKKTEKFEILKEHDKFYSKLVNSKKEKEILDSLDELRKKSNTLPEIKSLKKIYNDLSKDNKGKERKKDEIISDLLVLIDEYANGNELKPQFDIHKKHTEDLQKIASTYNSTSKQVTEFYNLCSKLTKKDTPDFWDRTALSVWAISQLAIPLLEIWKKEVWFADKTDDTTELLKSDLLQIYLTRYFLRDSNETKSLDDFKNALETEIPQKIAEYNRNISNGSKAELDSKKIDATLKYQLIMALEKIKKFDSTQEFNDKMWNYFVKDFLQKAPILNEQSATDKAWFFEQLFNITYHTADYLDFIKNNNFYSYNHLLLHNDFDLSKTEHYDFQLNHSEKSTTYSNRIFKWAEELGIKQLKVLVGKYLVKP